MENKTLDNLQSSKISHDSRGKDGSKSFKTGRKFKVSVWQIEDYEKQLRKAKNKKTKRVKCQPTDV